MFACIECSVKFKPDDIKDGKFFISTSTCLECYKKLAHSKTSCFGKENKYDNTVIACQECPDERICKVFVKHRDEF